MKRLLFRAWDKEEKMMYNWYDHKDWILDAIPWDCGDEWTERCEVMQWTGLYDCKKNFVFEGDFVIFDNREIGGEIVKGEIVWCDDRTLAPPSFGIWTSRGFFNTDFLGYIEVIGNVYETPNLLKDFKMEEKKFRIIIKADSNDADYITGDNSINERELEVVKRVSSKLITNGHNWVTSEYSSEENPFILYKDVLSKEDIEIFDDLVPYGEFGIHTILKIEVFPIPELIFKW